MFLDASLKKKHFQSRLKKAAEVSAHDIRDAILKFSRNPKPQEFLHLSKLMTTSSIWVSHSTLRYLLALTDFSIKNPPPTLVDTKTSQILEAINTGKPLPDGVEHLEAFGTLFRDIELSHYNSLYQQTVECPKINTTLVLVSGVFNEIFSTPAFARGAEHLSKKCGLKRISLKVSGTKGTRHNVELIHRQLETYISNRKNEKLWIVAFSKGGVDTLHYLKEYPEFAQKHIQGVSLMASPILGTGHLKHKALRAMLKLEKSFQKIRNSYDFLAEEFRQALSSEYQEEWFNHNYHLLPKNLFYTSLAFEAQWHQSHLWMVLTKIFFQSKTANDGVVDVDRTFFPDFFQGINLGILRGHHLVGTRSSYFSQEALLEAHLIYLNYLGKLN